MERKTPETKPAAQPREDRLKAALKANLARRKAQARARQAPGADKAGQTGDRKD
ncbi:hypothetical protein [Thetidibacter halocola]|uniref:Uncharacterized protein n=1 Tax=Thetidibacter halocola TaxID=2827239 RepID=A0A8J7WDE8_9RHOB|nr:hypothetical protein [Thetidibacter halocola]MBS0123103.1 hypothetical protein [Thetidibacter halocola]